MKKLIILLLLTSCSVQNANYDKNNEILNFSTDLNFEEFNQLLKKYAKISPYPNINK